MFYNSFNKKKTNRLKYTAKASNTQKKKKNLQYRDRGGKKTRDTEIEKEEKKKKTYDTDIDHRPFPCRT